MNRKIALLRGINVGRAKRVAMVDLRKLFEDLGYSRVNTVLNSGNVVFRGPDEAPAVSAKRIEAALALELGVAARVSVLSAVELDTVVAENALLALADNPSRLLVAVFMNPAQRVLLEPLLLHDWSPEALTLGQRAAYLWCPNGVLDSRAAAALGKLLGDAVTARNWSTISKLHVLASN